MRTTAFISLGSNLGHRRRTCHEALLKLTSHPEIFLKNSSSYYESEAITLDNTPQPPYLNQVVEIETSLDSRALLYYLLEIEKTLGRSRQERWGPRTIDLDILYYDNLVTESPELILPHPEIQNRPFILIPLMEIAPSWQDPKSKKSLEEMCRGLPQSQKVTRAS
ncbi:MAG: 2-amino-4-hydroxy-6-hydroxymethyldihydropteridine diphosphokinase [Deltaproteobacteria bacterium RIFCSPLOWO2_02_FULL_50_16]|nr:MAG: 2-amino-4-hydroxy-6-hydroxymethyldihydropteridine diphosphokinase [Deltaproteobacteria bacterium RIFCSPLOWO2_02_FULL_50_16]